jgi:hypothetical protein
VVTGAVVWDGKDMAAVQMLVHDLRQQGRPAATWSGGTLYLRTRPGQMLNPAVPVGATIERRGEELTITPAEPGN